MPEFCPTCGVQMSDSARYRRSSYVITPLGRAVLEQLRREQAR